MLHELGARGDILGRLHRPVRRGAARERTHELIPTIDVCQLRSGNAAKEPFEQTIVARELTPRSRSSGTSWNMR